jgi:hypothetical protein
MSEKTYSEKDYKSIAESTIKALEGCLLFINSDGSPCDGFRFRELMLEARAVLKQINKKDNLIIINEDRLEAKIISRPDELSILTNALKEAVDKNDIIKAKVYKKALLHFLKMEYGI